MKKIGEIVKPFLAIGFGALVFLYYLNWLSSGDDGMKAVGIIAMVLAAFYLTIGILGIFLGERLGKARKIFDMLSISLFAGFMFVYFVIVAVEANEGFGPAGWFIMIVSLTGSAALAVMHVVASLVRNKVVAKLDFLFGAIFTLVLLLNLLFNFTGDPINLGAINVILLVIYMIFTSMLFNALVRPVEKVEEKPEEKAEEPSEEKPQE